tara:strand:+ start:293 stop:865 length:573 start_codon:yes stop_codon:yes gene_type:complete
MKIAKSKLKEIIKEEIAKSFDEGVEAIDPQVMRAARDEDKRAFFSDTLKDLQAVGGAMLGYRMVDHTNPAKVKTATKMADPKDILLLGVTPEHIYFKTMDDIYYRMPRPGTALEEELGDDLGMGDIPHEFVLDELVDAASNAVGVAARNMLRRARIRPEEWPDIDNMIEEPLMDALTDLAKIVHRKQNEE